MDEHQNTKKIETLYPRDAMRLWGEGKDKWNKWVSENPEYHISFEKVEFSLFQYENEPNISFREFIFPRGSVDFSGAVFGEGNVDFSGVVFGDGSVDFSDVAFGDGSVDFSDVAFGDGSVDFSDVTFGDGNADFNRSTFGKGNVLFTNASFGDGYVSFCNAIFSEGDVNFNSVIFGEGGVNFYDVIFGEGDVNFFHSSFCGGEVDFDGVAFGKGCVNFSFAYFYECSVRFTCTTSDEGDVNFYHSMFRKGSVDFRSSVFGKGDVDFSDATFGKGGVDFSEMIFGEGNVNFSNVKFGKGNVMFIGSKFGKGTVNFSNAAFCEGNVNFQNATFVEGNACFENLSCKARFNFSGIGDMNFLSFRGATFDNVVSITRINLSSVVDLVNTKLTHQLSLHGLSYKLVLKRNRFGLHTAEDSNDVERLNRAKELAEVNKHYTLALNFHADEMRAKRWQPKTSNVSSILDFAFDKLCNYGQSVSRPFALLILSIMIFTLPYTLQSGTYKFSMKLNSEMLAFSAANSIPFLTSIRSARENGITKFYEGQSSLGWIYITMMLQGIVSTILFFLIGLGLRNRFRL